MVEFLLPGLSDAQMDRLCEPHGLVLPGELRAWWGWHNGTDIAAALERTSRGRGATLTGWKTYQPSLQEALDYRVLLLAEAQEKHAQLAPEQYWRPSYLPLTLGTNHTWIAELGEGEAVRVRRMAFDDAARGGAGAVAGQPGRALGRGASWRPPALRHRDLRRLGDRRGRLVVPGAD